jgi:predicted transposase YdaD
MTTESSLEYQIERLREPTRHSEESALGHANREVRKEYDMFMGERFRISAIMNTQFDKGLEQGKFEDARNFLKMGLTIEQVAKGTRLPFETIKEIQLSL